MNAAEVSHDSPLGQKIMSSKTPRGFIYHGLTDHQNLKTTMAHKVISKGKKEYLRRGEIVIIVDKDKNTKRYMACLAMATGQTSSDHTEYWPHWESKKKLTVHHVDILTRAFDVPTSQFPKICTRSNIHKDVKPRLLKFLWHLEKTV